MRAVHPRPTRGSAPADRRAAATARGRVLLTFAATFLTLPVLVAGCGGERYGPGAERPAEPDPASAQRAQAPADEAPAPAPSEPATPAIPTEPATAPLEPARTVGGLTWTPRASYGGPVRLAVRDGYLAAVVPSAGGALGEGELQFARPGAELEPAGGSGSVPAWAQPHVGTDARGRPVVTYPRCGSPARIGTCDAYAWSPYTRRERLLTAASGGTLAETEVVMDSGNVLVVREKRATLTADELMHETPSLTTLVYVAVGEEARVVTRHGGRAIDLRGERAADRVVEPAADGQGCVAMAARALDLGGATVARRDVPCAGGTDAVSAPQLTSAGHLRLSIVRRDGTSVALDHDLAAGTTQQAVLTQPVDWFTTDTASAGYALRTQLGGSTCEFAPAGASESRCVVERVSGLTWRPASAAWTISGDAAPVTE